MLITPQDLFGCCQHVHKTIEFQRKVKAFSYSSCCCCSQKLKISTSTQPTKNSVMAALLASEWKWHCILSVVVVSLFRIQNRKICNAIQSFCFTELLLIDERKQIIVIKVVIVTLVQKCHWLLSASITKLESDCYRSGSWGFFHAPGCCFVMVWNFIA